MTAEDRLVLEMALEENLLAQERITSLEADVESSRTMVQQLLATLNAELEYTRRLTYRLHKANGHV